MLNGSDWHFTKFLPDIDDLSARYNDCEQFLTDLYDGRTPWMDINVNRAAEVEIFHFAFIHGAAWMKAKIDAQDKWMDYIRFQGNLIKRDKSSITDEDLDTLIGKFLDWLDGRTGFTESSTIWRIVQDEEE